MHHALPPRDAVEIRKFPTGEFYDTVGEREEGVIRAAGDITAGHNLGAALPHNDISRASKLAVRHLDAESLPLRIATQLC